MTAPDPAPQAALRPGRELARNNRRIIAARIEWPEGALETCERLEGVYPDWDADYRHENTAIRGWEVRAGFYATQWNPPHGHKTTVYGPDADALGRAIEANSSRCQTCAALLPIRPGSSPPTHQVPGGDDYCHGSWTQLTREVWFSGCPSCGARLEVMVGTPVPPHKTYAGELCPTRCSQPTV